MLTIKKTSIFPASRHAVFLKLKELKTLQYIAAPYATFTPVDVTNAFIWAPGSATSYHFKLFGIIPYGTHTIRIEKFDEAGGVSSRESNKHVPVWNHDILLEVIDDAHTQYTDIVTIDAGWKTIFIYVWARCFYSHRQRKWKKLLSS